MSQPDPAELTACRNETLEEVARVLADMAAAAMDQGGREETVGALLSAVRRVRGLEG